MGTKECRISNLLNKLEKSCQKTVRGLLKDEKNKIPFMLITFCNFFIGFETSVKFCGFFSPINDFFENLLTIILVHLQTLKLYIVKKGFTSFPSPAGMSLTKLPLGRNNSVMTSLYIAQGEFGSDIPAKNHLQYPVSLHPGRGRETREPFFTVFILKKQKN